MVAKQVIEKLNKKIRLYIKQRQISIYQFSQECEVSLSTIYKVINNKTDITVRTIEKIQIFLKENLEKEIKAMNDKDLREIYNAAQKELIQRNIKYITKEKE